jgi:DNA-binding NarL/FixJ family response regulator
MPGLQIRGLAMCVADGMERAGLVQPDVVLVDAELPHEAASATIRQLRDCLPSARVVALGLYPDRRAAMLAAGAHAFVLKDAGFEALLAAITAVGSLDGADRELSHRACTDRLTSDRSDLTGTAESASASVRTPGSVV